MCKTCKNIFYISPSRKNIKKFCSRKCYTLAAATGNLPYIRIRINGKRVLEHRYIMEQFIGRQLKSNEHVHHINHNKSDNRIENLQIMNPSEHVKLHTRTY